MSAEHRQVLLVALSGRSLALAATRAGYRPRVLDLFGDVDTRRLAEQSVIVPGSLADGFDAGGLIEAAERLAPAAYGPWGLAYASGLESRPELLAELCRGRTLWGNRPEVLRAVKDPAQFFALLGRLGLPHPEIRREPPADPSGWLAKRIGAAGGGHVKAAKDETGAAPQRYFQRRVDGKPMSCLFLADGGRAQLLGWSEQWPSPDPLHPFRFGGAVQPADVPEGVARPITAALDPMVRATGLVGLNSLDFMLAENGAFHLLEVNPRPGASLDIFDGEGEGALFARHVAACEGRLLPGWRRPSRASAMAVVYADRPLQVPARMEWPGWLADRPTPRSSIETGAPVCTVMAEAETVAGARALVRERNRRVLEVLASGTGSLLAEGCRLGDDRAAMEKIE